MIELDRQKAEEFLAKNNLQNCQIEKIAGDASFRSYYRIFANKEKFILMFAPPSHEDIRPFKKVDEFLIKNNFSAPKIFAADEKNGFLLLEDFGDETYGKILSATAPEKLENLEFDLYKKACDCLLELHKITAPIDLPHYNHAALFREVMLFVDWYLPSKNKVMNLSEKSRFKFLWFQLFDLLDKENQSVVLRDYHADNLMILKNKKAHQQVGLLDFQDALIGSRAYDLVSLLEDARRDLNEKNRVKIFEHYLKNSAIDEEIFIRDYKILSLQRNLKIIGIFSRLAIRDGKKNYLQLLPRVISFVKIRIEKEDRLFSEISNLIKKFIYD